MKVLKKTAFIGLFLLTMVMSMFLPASVAKAAESAGYDGYVYVTIERSTVNQGVLLEPVKVGYHNGDNVGQLLFDLVGKENLSGSTSYVKAIKDGGQPEGWTVADVPDAIKDALGGEDNIDGERSGDDATFLGETDYTLFSGWTYSVNDVAPSVGMDSFLLDEDDNNAVIRVQFTLYGWGSDIVGMDNTSWGGSPSLCGDFPSKLDLIRRIADYDGDKSAKAYTDAIDVLGKWDATKKEVDKALSNKSKISIVMNAVSQTAVLKNAKGEVVDLGEPTSRKYTAVVENGTYTLVGLDKDGATENGSLEIEVNGDAEYKVFTVTASCSDKTWTYGTDFAFENVKVVNNENVSRSFEVGNVSTNANARTFLVLSGDSYQFDMVPKGAKATADEQGNVYATIPASGTVTFNATKSIAPAYKTTVAITIPYEDSDNDSVNDYVLEEGMLSTYFIFSYNEPAKVDKRTDAETYTFEGIDNQSYFYRVKNTVKDDAVTYGNYFTMKGNTTCEVTTKDLYEDVTEGIDYNKNSVVRDFSNNTNDVGDIYLNINEKGMLDLNKGESFTLYPFRNWFIVEGISNAKPLQPDFHCQVLDENGQPSDAVVSVKENLANDTKKHSFEVEAKAEGTAIILVTYDALTYPNALGHVKDSGDTFSAIWPENTGVFVVTVGKNTKVDTGMTIWEGKNTTDKKLAGDAIDSELDVIYYEGEEGATYSFKPESGASVEVASPSILDKASYSGFSAENVAVAEDGTVTLSGLKEGSHIVKVTKGDAVSYQIIRTKETAIEVSAVDPHGNAVDLDSVEVGDTVTATFDRLYHPAQKFSGFYNMSAVATYINNADEVVKGGSAQYNFPSNAKAHQVSFTIPSTWTMESYKLVNGYLGTTGFGSAFGSHRGCTYPAGKPANFTAVSNVSVLGVLPDIEIPVKVTTSRFEGKVEVLDENEEATKDYVVTIYDQNEKEYKIDKNNAIALAAGDYHYVVTKDHYETEEGDFTVSENDFNVKIVLKRATIKVTVGAYDYTAKDAGIEKASETGVIFEEEMQVYDDISIEELLAKVAEKSGKTIDVFDNGYFLSVNGINGLTSADGGGYSGWCLSYNNDDYSNEGISTLTLKDGDVLRFDYSVNADYNTDDIGNGWYGLPIFNELTIGTEKEQKTVHMSKTTSYDPENYDVPNTVYKVGDEELTQAGTEEDPFVVNVAFDEYATVGSVKVNTFKTSLHNKYAIVDGIEEGATAVDGMKFSISSLGGLNKAYFVLHITMPANVNSDNYQTVLNQQLAALAQNVATPVFGSIGGDWAAIALARGGYENPQWYHIYAENVASEVKGEKLHNTKSTDNARAVVGLTAIGADPTNVAGVDLTKALTEYDYVVKQGINGPIWALIALDTKNYAAESEIRSSLITYILEHELENGGWALMGTDADIDITAMAIQALAPYYEKAEVEESVNRALAVLAKKQNADGSYSYGGKANCESTAQVLCALTALGIDTEEDARFIKNSNSVLDALLKYATENGFEHELTQGVNGMASEQGTYALVAYSRLKNEKNSLYAMSDATVVYAKDHIWDAGKVTKEPTVDAEGEKTFTCVCGKTKVETVDKLKKPESTTEKKPESTTEKKPEATTEQKTEATTQKKPEVTTEATTQAQKITVKKAKIKKAVSKKKQTITVTWKRLSGVTGYQIQVSTSSKFAKNKTKTYKVKNAKKTSKTIKSLKAKKYYVRVRGYKTTKVNNKAGNTYGAWSKKKTVRMK